MLLEGRTGQGSEIVLFCQTPRGVSALVCRSLGLPSAARGCNGQLRERSSGKDLGSSSQRRRKEGDGCCFGIEEFCLRGKNVCKKEKVIKGGKHCRCHIGKSNSLLDLATVSLVTLMRARSEWNGGNKTQIVVVRLVKERWKQ